MKMSPRNPLCSMLTYRELRETVIRLGNKGGKAVSENQSQKEKSSKKDEVNYPESQ